MRVFVIVAVLAALPLAAQAPAQTPAQSPSWEFFARGNWQVYQNFFQAPKGQPEEDVTALQAEVGANVKVSNAVTVFGNLNLLHFNDDTLEDSPGGRIGVRGDLRPHAYEVYAEVLSNRPSFELDEFAGADIRRVHGEYSYRLLQDWQLSVDADLEQQEFDNDIRDNDYVGFGPAVRWRGSRVFSPELGFRMGEREVNDASQTYDQREWYLQIRSQPVQPLYLSVRYRDRTRDYQNVDREDQRRQISFGADYTVNEHLVLNLYGAREDVDSNLTGRDFDSGFWLLGATWRF